jgi:predicted permease
MQDEMQLHLDLLEADLQRQGLAPAEAHRRARARFGSVLATRDGIRQALGWRLLDELRADVTYACRLLRRSPVFAGVAVLSLALGIGANAAIFSLIDTVLLKSLPIHDPASLFFIDNSGGKSGGSSGPPYPCFEILRDQNTTLAGIAAYRETRFKVTIDGNAEEMRGEYASGNLFEVLGVRPALGRLLAASDDSTMGGGDGAVAVISDGLWRRRFGARADAIGKTMVVGTRVVTIIGVAPPEYFGLQVGSPIEVTVPITLSENNLRARQLWWFSVIGRIKPGIPVEQARAELHGLWDRYMTDNGQPPGKRNAYFSGVELVPAARGLAALRRQLSEPLLIVMTIVGLVLLIGCANIANLLLARASARRDELAVRMTVGASRARLIRQLLTEGAVLSAAGLLAGIVLARWGTAFIVGVLARAEGGPPLEAQFGLRLIGFTVLVGAVAALLFSLAPAIHTTRSNAAVPLPAGVTAPWPMQGRLGQSLVIVQVMLSIVLLSGAALFLRTLQNLASVDSGFNPEGVIAMRVETTLPRPTLAKPQPGDIIAYHAQLGKAWSALAARIGEVPGVSSAAVATMTPLSGNDRGVHAAVTGAPPLSEDQRYIHINHVTPDYFPALRIPLGAGRYFSETDLAGAPRVAILNRTAAAAYFGGESPVGRRISFPGQRVEDDYEVVGVVGDVRYENARTEDERMAYLPVEQAIDPVRGAIVIARAGLAAGPSIRDAITKNIAGGFVPRVESLSDETRISLTRERLLSILASVFGGLALLLACIGLYGIMAYGVMRRTREIGIRLAIGATQASVMWMVLREMLIVVVIGVAAGVVAVVPAARFVRSQLFGVTPADPVAIGVAIVVLLLVAAAAGYLPARRATRVDPVTALRYE